MKQILILIVVALILLSFGLPICSADSFSATYKIKVFIPQMVSQAPTFAEINDTEDANLGWVTITESIERNGETIICNTTTLK